MDDFQYIPHPDQKNAKIALTAFLAAALIVLILRAVLRTPLVFDLLFLMAAAGAIYIYIRYFYSEFLYSVSRDGIFEVRRLQGRKVTVYCSVPLSAILQTCVTPRTEIPKGCFMATKSMLPASVLLLTLYSDTGKEQYIALEAETDFITSLQAAMRNLPDVSSEEE